MHSNIILIVIFICFISTIFSLPQWYQGKLIRNNLEENIVSKSQMKDELYFTQKVDHFNRELNTTFQQRYFINDTYWGKSEKSPVFLCVGGEGPPLDKSVLVSSVHCNDMVELAPKVGALLVALEHRYYGFSNPFGKDFSTDSLQYLNSEQALEDISSFHSFITNKHQLSNQIKWITWGGSYPGMLAALARLRYPTLFHAAVSSSAPLQPSVDMPGYNNIVAESMASKDVGGSQECLDSIIEGHKTIGDMLKTNEGIASLEKQFNICNPNTLQDLKNQEVFAGDGVVYLPVQSNDPACTTPYCDIASICVLMTNDTIGSSLDRLISLSNIQNLGHCLDPSYESLIKFYSAPHNSERSWLYQTCTEWGFYQTCEIGSQCPYTQGLHDLSIDYDICLNAFNIKSDEVDYEIQQTLLRYGGNQIQSSRIFFINGQIDPWRANSVNVSPYQNQKNNNKEESDKEPTLLVTGSSHHFWTHPSLPTDSIFIQDARLQIWNQVIEWLNE